MATELWLLVGLGNPGSEYDGTRHNIGFDCLDALAGAAPWKSKFGALAAETVVAGVRCVLLKPQGFMNRSGGPAQQCAAFFKVPPERTIVLHDDLDIPFGALRLKLGGGDGGHNGLKSVTEHLGPDYIRVRIGIGRPQLPTEHADRKAPAVVSWVLGRFTKEEGQELPALREQVSACLQTLLSEGLAKAQNRFHRSVASS